MNGERNIAIRGAQCYDSAPERDRGLVRTANTARSGWRVPMASPKQLVALVVPEDGAERLLELAEREPEPVEEPRQGSGWSRLLKIATGIALGAAFALYTSARERQVRPAPEAAPPVEEVDRQPEAGSDDG